MVNYFGVIPVDLETTQRMRPGRNLTTGLVPALPHSHAHANKALCIQMTSQLDFTVMIFPFLFPCTTRGVLNVSFEFFFPSADHLAFFYCALFNWKILF